MAEKDDKGFEAVSEWALPDSHWDEALDGISDYPERPKQKKDPETGRFLPVEKPAEPQPQKVEPTPPAAPKHSHSASLSRLAADLGMAPDEIDATPAEQLQDAVYQRHNAIKAMIDRERQLTPRETAAPPAPPPPPEDELAELGELKDEIDPRFANLLRRVLRENKELKAVVGEVRGHLQQKANETRDQWIDRIYDEHGDAGRFGRKADGKGLTQDQLQRRQHVVKLAALRAGPQAPEKQIIETIPTILKELFGPAEAAAAPPEVNGKARVSREEWDDAALLKPSQRMERPEPKGTRRAEKKVAETIRGWDFDTPEEGGIEEAGLPD